METNFAQVVFSEKPSDSQLSGLIGKSECASSSTVLRKTNDGFEVVIKRIPVSLIAVWMTLVALAAGVLIGRNEGWKQGAGILAMALMAGGIVTVILHALNLSSAAQGPWIRFKMATKEMKVLGVAAPILIGGSGQELICIEGERGGDHFTQFVLIESMAEGWRATRLWHMPDPDSGIAFPNSSLADQTANALGLPLRRIRIKRFADPDASR